MVKQILHLKNMTSRSCITLVQYCLNNYKDVKVNYIRLGEISFDFEASKTDLAKILLELKNSGFDQLHNENDLVAEKIKIAVIELIYLRSNINSLIRNSEYISDKLQLPYSKLSKIFSKINGITIEKFIILLKIEKTKELINNKELTLSEISYTLGYSSVQYLSNQFKKVTGWTVSEYKSMENPPRISLDKLLKE